MSMKEERRKVLELIYKEMSHASNYSYPKELADIVKALEAAELAEREAELKSKLAEAENSNKEREFDLKEQELDIKERELEIKHQAMLAEREDAKKDRELQEKARLRELIVNSCITVGTTALWGLIFVHELRATRKFEMTGTEVSAASRWLKNAFPKVKLF